MSFVNLCKYAIWRVFEIICKKHNIYALVNTRTGLKNININRLYGNPIQDVINKEVIYVDPSKLFLGTDYLKDKFSLIECSILDSPHYDFIKAINEGRDIKKTDYYERFVSGTLDERHCQWGRKLSYFYEKNENAKRSIEKGDYNPVIIYPWKNRLYIYDGKHRAAYCALMDKQVKCVMISFLSDFCYSPINNEIYRIMTEDKQYTKHIKFYNDGEK